MTLVLTDKQTEQLLPFSNPLLTVSVYFNSGFYLADIAFVYIGEQFNSFRVTKYFKIKKNISEEEYEKLTIEEQLNNTILSFDDIIINTEGLNYTALNDLVVILQNLPKLTPEFMLDLLKQVYTEQNIKFNLMGGKECQE